ncbi:MAG: hypothetical protein ACX936_09485, partial [Marinobacter sp.]
ETNLSMWGRQGAGEKKAGIVQVCRQDCEAAETRIKRLASGELCGQHSGSEVPIHPTTGY